MHVNYKIVVAGLCTSLLAGCATFNKQVNSFSSFEKSNDQSLVHRFYLVGDGGYVNKSEHKVLFTQLKDSLSKEEKSTTILFLGDNIYPNGMPKKEHKQRKKAEQSINNQLDLVSNFEGKTIFIPGNHDWYSNGLNGLKREENYIEKAIGKKSFLPENGCPIEKVNISEDIVLLIIDSQWYITNWDKHPTINDDCEIKTRAQFLDEILIEIKKAQDKTILIALHHPVISNGPHGGQYSFQDHLKPIPVLGTVKNVLRKTAGISNTDLSNRHYNDLAQKLKTYAQYNDRVIFISGHEHSLQHIEDNGVKQIISGSASKKSPTRLAKNHQFSYGETGYAVLDIYNNGFAEVKYISTSQTEYKTTIFNAQNAGFDNTFHMVTSDSVSASIYTEEEIDKGGFYKLLWGNRYRSQYAQPVKAPVAYLDTLYGGLTPFRKGGGTQSKSLHLKDAAGKRYVLRAMKKQASQYLQATIFKDEYLKPKLKNTAVENLVKDAFTGSYPYAPLVVGTLSKAINLAHLNPKLIYVPKQESLGKFNDLFGDELYMIEEQASDGHLHLGTENFTGKIESTEDLLKEIISDESVVVDTAEYLKARLFDMLIGDWDRHQDQWRWMKYKEKGKTVYKPLPRDRDQAFSKMSDGFMLGAAAVLIPQARLLRKYEPNIKSIDGFNFEALPLDLSILQNLNEQQWQDTATYIQQQISDEVINQAFLNIPRELQDQSVENIKLILKQRRENLKHIAQRYFEYISRCRIIKATHKDDYIKISSKENGEVEITIARIMKGNVQKPFYIESFNPMFTNEIWVYGLDDTDTFEVAGKSKKIKIKLIGGQNNDTYNIEHGRNITVYDFKSKENTLENTHNAKIKLRDDYNLNTYYYKKHKYTFKQILPKLSYNPDEGFIIGGSFSHTTFALEQNPFSMKHKVGASYFSSTSGFELEYSGEFAHFFHRANLIIESSYNTPKFSTNFFGLGNETQNNDDELGLDFNRTLLEMFSFQTGLKWQSYGGTEILARLKYQTIKVENTPNRILDGTNLAPESIFKTQQFGSINTTISYQNQDNISFPTMGIKAKIETGYTQNLDQSNRNFFYLIPELVFDYKLTHSGNLVLATHLNSQLNFNDTFEYYQGANIGGNNGLRGFRNERFTGQKSFYQNTDVRLKLGDLENNIIPMQYGVYASFDYGRVWVSNDTSNLWHHSQGGGFYLSMAEKFLGNLGVFNTVEGFRLMFNLGFNL